MRRARLLTLLSETPLCFAWDRDDDEGGGGSKHDSPTDVQAFPCDLVRDGNDLFSAKAQEENFSSCMQFHEAVLVLGTVGTSYPGLSEGN